MLRLRYQAVAALVILLVAACSSPGATTPATEVPTSGASSEAPSAPASAAADPLAELYEAAQAEGQIVRWGGEDPPQMQEIFAAFSEKYPGLQITETQINPNDAPQKLLTEKAAGQAPPDLFQGQFQFNEPLEGLINTDPGWAQYGVPESAVRPDGGVMTLFSPYVLAFNTEQIQKEELPTTWEGLADPKYAGKLSVDPRAFPFSLLAPKLGTEETLALVQNLKDEVNPAIVQGSTAGLTGLMAGEYALRPALLEDVKTQQATGAPIDYVVLDPAPVQITAWYTPAEAEHPNAAKLYASWFATEGMAMTYEQGFKSNTPPEDIPAEMFYAPETTEDFATIAEVTPEISAIWGNPQ